MRVIISTVIASVVLFAGTAMSQEPPETVVDKCSKIDIWMPSYSHDQGDDLD